MTLCDESRPVPVIYEIDEFGEANGRILFFCSVECRANHPTPLLFAYGTNTDWLNGTVCDQCGEELI
jgi:hypothetical protein